MTTYNNDDFNSLTMESQFYAEEQSYMPEQYAQQNEPVPTNTLDYINNFMRSDIDENKNYQNKETGFWNIDKRTGGLKVGLYAIGGVSSVGKTTFVHNLAENLAENGEHVLYFSLEQTQLEMVSKSFARRSYKLFGEKGFTSIEFREGLMNDAVKASVFKYKEYGERMTIITPYDGIKMSQIKEVVEEYIRQHNVKPVVVVDYLQLIKAENAFVNDKVKIDENVTSLKRMSMFHKIPVMIISSFNRNSYLNAVSFESFKESGGIEYTADVIWGLQYSIVNKDEFISLNKQTEKVKMLDEAKQAGHREITLSCIKTRNGSLFDVNFKYVSKFDYYSSTESKPRELSKEETEHKTECRNGMHGGYDNINNFKCEARRTRKAYR